MKDAIKYVVIGIVIVSLWRASNGDISWAIDAVITLFNTAADALVGVWHTVMGIAPSSDTVPKPSGSP